MKISSVIQHLHDHEELYVVGGAKVIQPYGGLNIMEIKINKYLGNMYIEIYYYGQRDNEHVNAMQRIPLDNKVEIIYARKELNKNK